MENRLKDLEKKVELMNTEIESLIISSDIHAAVVEALDRIGVIVYKLYNYIKEVKL